MKMVSKLLITGLIAASLSPAAYAACNTQNTSNCVTAKCGSNTITYNNETRQICINGKCITSGFILSGSLNNCTPFNILDKIFNGTNGNCPIFPITPPADSPEQPEASPVPTETPAPEATQIPENAEPTQAPTAAPTQAPTAAPTQAPTAAPTQAPTAAPTQTPGASTNASAMEREVFNLVNQVRAENGLSALTWADDLANVARAHSKDMINRGFFSHTNPDGYSPFDRLKNNGISYRTAAENIAYGQKTAQSVMNAWMNSSGHRANILNANVKEIGVGAATASNGTIYWTQMFVAR